MLKTAEKTSALFVLNRSIADPNDFSRLKNNSLETGTICSQLFLTCLLFRFVDGLLARLLSVDLISFRKHVFLANSFLRDIFTKNIWFASMRSVRT